MPAAVTPFEVLLSEAMERRGLSLGRIRYHLRRRGHDLSVATLSYWRRGLARPTRERSLAAVRALEEILELQAGTLTGALVERIDPGDSGGPGEQDLAASIGLSWDDGLVRTSMQDEIVLDEQGRAVLYRIRETAVAQRTGVDRYPAALWPEDPEVVVRLRADGNCEIGREIKTDEAWLAEVLLPHTLQMGESWTTDVSLLREGATRPTQGWGRFVTTKTSLLHFSIRFAPARVPLSAVLLTEVRGVTTSAPLVLAGSALEVHLVDFGPGEAHVTWTW